MVKMDIPMGHLPVVCKNGYPYIHQATSGKFARYSLQSKSSFHLKTRIQQQKKCKWVTKSIRE